MFSAVRKLFADSLQELRVAFSNRSHVVKVRVVSDLRVAREPRMSPRHVLQSVVATVILLQISPPTAQVRNPHALVVDDLFSVRLSDQIVVPCGNLWAKENLLAEQRSRCFKVGLIGSGRIWSIAVKVITSFGSPCL